LKEKLAAQKEFEKKIAAIQAEKAAALLAKEAAALLAEKAAV